MRIDTPQDQSIGSLKSVYNRSANQTGLVQYRQEPDAWMQRVVCNRWEPERT